MALSANALRSYDQGDINTLPVKASAVIYQGAAVGDASGYARGLVAGDQFLGFAIGKVTGGSADADITVQVWSRGKVQLTISAIAVTDNGKPVYASADGTFTLTQGSNSYIGVVHRWISTGECIVTFDASNVGGTTGVAVLTDSSTGAAADNTIGAVTAPTALTDNGGGTADNTVQAQAAFAASASWNGSSVYPSAADEAALTAIALAARNNMKELTTAQAANRLAIVALTDAVAELATKVNEIIRAAR